MKVKTRNWGEIEATYWRDDQGREGLRSATPLPGMTTRLILPRDLAASGYWESLLDAAIKEMSESSAKAKVKP